MRALWLLVLVLLAGCGLSASDEPEPISQDKVPPELRDPGGASGDVALPEGGDVVLVEVWFFRQEGDEGVRLRPVDRRVPGPATPARRLDALLNGPLAAENEEGISTAIPSDTSQESEPERDGSTLRVNLSPRFYEEQRGERARTAFAQVVFTATAIEGVESVQFLLDGEPFKAFDGEGEQREGPMTRADYGSLLREG